MEPYTEERIARIYANASGSVELINKFSTFSEWQAANPLDFITTEKDWKAEIQRNVEHLETIKTFKTINTKTSIWTTEDFTDIDSAITTGKAIYS